MASFQPGDVFEFDFPPAIGSEVDGKRYVIVIDECLFPRLETVVIVPLSAEPSRRSQATCVAIDRTATNGLSRDSSAICHLVTAAPKKLAMSAEPLGSVDQLTLERVRLQVADILGISGETLFGG